MGSEIASDGLKREGGTVEYVPATPVANTVDEHDVRSSFTVRSQETREGGMLAILEKSGILKFLSDVDDLVKIDDLSRGQVERRVIIQEVVNMLEHHQRIQQNFPKFTFTLPEFIQEAFEGHAFVFELEDDHKLVFVFGGKKGQMGKGGMGVVNAALVEDDPFMNLYKANNGRDRVAKRESTLLGKLSKKSTMGLPHMHGIHHATNGIVMRHHSGVLLKKLVGQPLSNEGVYRIVLSAAYALREVHQEDIAHGDLTKNNVLVADDGSAVIIDFGLGRHPEHDDEFKDNPDFAGTPNETTPTIVADGAKKISKEEDVASLGANVFFPLLKQGRRVHSETSVNTVIKERTVRSLKMAEEQTNALAALTIENPGAAHLLRKMVAVDPRERPTIHEVLTELVHMIFKGKYQSPDEVPMLERGLQFGDIPIPDPQQEYPNGSIRFGVEGQERAQVLMANAIREMYPDPEKLSVEHAVIRNNRKLVYTLTAVLLLAGVGVAYMAKPFGSDGHPNPENRDKKPNGNGIEDPAKLLARKARLAKMRENPAAPFTFTRNQEGMWSTKIRVGGKEIDVPEKFGAQLVADDGKSYGRIYELSLNECLRLQGAEKMEDLHAALRRGCGIMEYHFPDDSETGFDTYVFMNGLGEFVNGGETVFSHYDEAEGFAIFQSFSKKMSRGLRGRSQEFEDLWVGKSLQKLKIRLPEVKTFLPRGPINGWFETFRNNATDHRELLKALSPRSSLKAIFSPSVALLHDQRHDLPDRRGGPMDHMVDTRKNMEFALPNQLLLQKTVRKGRQPIG